MDQIFDMELDCQQETDSGHMDHEIIDTPYFPNDNVKNYS